MQKPIYLDYNATTPVEPRVFEALLPYLQDSYGNPASQLHQKGWEAHRAVETSRQQIANLLHCQPSEIAFTSGATESNNWALKGLLESLHQQRPDEIPHVLTSKVEHASVREPLRHMQKIGLIEVDFLPVDEQGFLHLETLQKARKPNTRIISLIWIQNEIGTIQNIHKIADWAYNEKIYFHTDATQAIGKVPVNLTEVPISLLSFSGHKIYGPKGIGALFIRQKNPKIQLTPLLDGGGQERLGRSGTANMPGIVGIGKACEIAGHEMATDWERTSKLAQEFWTRLQQEFPQLILNGPGFPHRSVYNLNITFPDVQAFNLLPKIQRLCVSGGSACSSDNVQASPTLLAIGHRSDDKSINLRISLGKMTTADDLQEALHILSAGLKSLNYNAVPTEPVPS